MTLNLVGQAPSGNVYRLRDAVITVRGPTSTKVWNTEDNPDQTSLSANVVTGEYSASLRDGWRIERVEGLSATTLPAQLMSDNPAQFTVTVNQRTSVPLRFRVDAEDVDLTQGYDITLVVQEPPPPVLVVTNQGNENFPASVVVFPADASGNAAPLRTIAGAATTLVAPVGVTIADGEIIVCDISANALDFYPIAANGNVAPTRQIIGPATGLSAPVGVVVFDHEIYVSQASGSILVFPLAATGNVASTRTVSVFHNAAAVAIDNGELYVTTFLSGTIVVYPITASGSATPTRTIQELPGEQLCASGISIRRGEIFVSDACLGAVRVYPETANGPVHRVREIAGASTGLVSLQRLAAFQGEVYVAEVGTSTIRVFPANANGDVTPTRVLGGASTQIAIPSAPFVF